MDKLNPASIMEALVHSQGIALFAHLGNGLFRPIGSLPPWFLEIAGPQPSQESALQLGERSPFLQNFLTDAEEVWDSQSAQLKSSGLWIEKGADGREIALEASALYLQGLPILLLQNPQDSYQQQQQWLQTARQSRLKHDRLGREIQKKEILLHCIIHDLSQPLSAMRGCFSCLELETALDAIHKLAQAGLQQSRLQEQMIREILEAFSEELASQAAASKRGSEPPDITATAAEVVKDYVAAFAEKNARIKVDASVDRSRDWKVVGDESRLRRIFANLVENALRVSPPDSTVTLGVVDEGPFVLAFVDDEGPGFAAGKPLPQFSLFGKGKEHGGKAGLGLYFCRITVEQWGGAIGCENRPERGARFWFRLPRAAGEPKTADSTTTQAHAPEPTHLQKETPKQADTHEPAPEASGQPGAPGRPLGATWYSLRVLVAEDTEVNQELIALMLEKRGHSSAPARDGREVLEALAKEKFDVVLMDHEMPEMNGIEATKAIRQQEQGTDQHIPIIGVTGMALMNGREACLAAGMDECLPKPFQVDELYQAIERFFFIPFVTPPERPKETVLPETNPLAYVGGNPKFVQKLVRVFLSDSSKKLAAIRQAISRRDAQTLASSAHSLAGSAGVFDAKTFAATSRQLESMGRSGNFEGIDAVRDSLENEFLVLKAELQKQLPQAAPPVRAPQRTSRSRKVKKRRKT